MRVTRREPKLVGDRIQAYVAATIVKIHQFLDDFHLGGFSGRDLGILKTRQCMCPDREDKRVHFRRSFVVPSLYRATVAILKSFSL
jgi:hypothetical protein